MKLYARFALTAAITLAGFGSLLAADDAKEEAIKKDRVKYFGEWSVVALEVDGNQVKEQDAKKFTVVNGADGTWSIAADGAIMVQGTSEIDPTKQPKTVDLTVTTGESKGETLLGIYEFGDDTRKVCFAQAGKERPAEFSSPAGSGRILALLKRIKK